MVRPLTSERTCRLDESESSGETSSPPEVSGEGIARELSHLAHRGISSDIFSAHDTRRFESFAACRPSQVSLFVVQQASLESRIATLPTREIVGRTETLIARSYSQSPAGMVLLNNDAAHILQLWNATLLAAAQRDPGFLERMQDARVLSLQNICSENLLPEARAQLWELYSSPTITQNFPAYGRYLESYRQEVAAYTGGQNPENQSSLLSRDIFQQTLEALHLPISLPIAEAQRLAVSIGKQNEWEQALTFTDDVIVRRRDHARVILRTSDSALERQNVFREIFVLDLVIATRNIRPSNFLATSIQQPPWEETQQHRQLDWTLDHLPASPLQRERIRNDLERQLRGAYAAFAQAVSTGVGVVSAANAISGFQRIMLKAGERGLMTQNDYRVLFLEEWNRINPPLNRCLNWSDFNQVRGERVVTSFTPQEIGFLDPTFVHHGSSLNSCLRDTVDVFITMPADILRQCANSNAWGMSLQGLNIVFLSNEVIDTPEAFHYIAAHELSHIEWQSRHLGTPTARQLFLDERAARLSGSEIGSQWIAQHPEDALHSGFFNYIRDTDNSLIPNLLSIPTLEEDRMAIKYGRGVSLENSQAFFERYPTSRANADYQAIMTPGDMRRLTPLARTHWLKTCPPQDAATLAASLDELDALGSGEMSRTYPTDHPLSRLLYSNAGDFGINPLGGLTFTPDTWRRVQVRMVQNFYMDHTENDPYLAALPFLLSAKNMRDPAFGQKFPSR